MKSLFLFIILFLGISAHAQLSFNPAPVSGSIGLTSSSTNISVTNTSLTTVVNTAFSVATNSAGIFISINRCAVINPRQTCQVTISYSNYGRSTSGVAVDFKNGSSVVAALTYSPAVIVPQFSSFSISSLTMNDFNTYSLTILNKTLSAKTYSPTFSGTDASKFSVTLNRCQNIAPNASCSISIKLSPQFAGSYSASLVEPQVTGAVALSSTITPQTTGFLQQSNSSLTFSPSSLSFGTLRSFGNSTPQTITVTNNGNVALTPLIRPSTRIALTSNRCAVNLLPGQSCTVSVSLSPLTSDYNGPIYAQSVDIRISESNGVGSISVSGFLNVPPAWVNGALIGGTCPPGYSFQGGTVCIQDPIQTVAYLAPNIVDSNAAMNRFGNNYYSTQNARVIAFTVLQKIKLTEASIFIRNYDASGNIGLMILSTAFYNSVNSSSPNLGVSELRPVSSLSNGYNGDPFIMEKFLFNQGDIILEPGNYYLTFNRQWTNSIEVKSHFDSSGSFRFTSFNGPGSSTSFSDCYPFEIKGELVP